MKARTILLLAALTFCACSSDDDEVADPSTYGFDWCSYLSGSWHGEVYWASMKWTETEDIVFAPFDSPRTFWGYYSGTFDAYGTAEVTTWYGTVKACVFTISKWTVEPTANLSFYRYKDTYTTDSEDKRVITVQSDSVFLMKPYGTGDGMNLTYTRQW